MKRRKRKSTHESTPHSAVRRLSIQSPPPAGDSSSTRTTTTTIRTAPSPTRSCTPSKERKPKPHFCTPSPVTKLRVSNSIGKPKPKRYTKLKTMAEETRCLEESDGKIIATALHTTDWQYCLHFEMASGMTQIPFLVTAASSEDDEHPALHLQAHQATTSNQGWQSAKFCDYPQDLVLIVNHGKPVDVAKVELLIHQTKIPTQIELYSKDQTMSNYRKLGYVAVDSNKATQYQARELKTISLDCRAITSFKFVIQGCHTNVLNVFSQVGIVSVALFRPQGVSKNPQSPKKPMDSQLSPVQTTMANQVPNDDPLDANLSSHQTTFRQVLERLREQRDKKIESEDYLAAKQIKEVEDQVLQCSHQLHQLQRQKLDVISRQDFDTASLLKNEIDRLVTKVSTSVQTILPRAPASHGSSRASSPRRKRQQSPPKNTHITLQPLHYDNTEPSIAEPMDAKLAEACQGIEAYVKPSILCQAFSHDEKLRKPAVRELVATLKALPQHDEAPFVWSILLPWLRFGLAQLSYHIFSTACACTLATAATFQSSRELVAGAPSLISILIQRLGDNAAKVRNKAGVVLLELANEKDGLGPQCILSNIVAFQTTAMTPTNWRLLQNLTRVLTTLLIDFECPIEATDIQTMLSFIHVQNGFGHAQTSVCDATTQFIVAIYHVRTCSLLRGG
ncbi:hypothetical protein AC1031_009176 [Aphanomyces cochlioides]|nr:hypothetical protein AC1031_009176 [Aphanomyces cochlioides]